jgi:hypothetical protein
MNGITLVEAVELELHPQDDIEGDLTRIVENVQTLQEGVAEAKKAEKILEAKLNGCLETHAIPLIKAGLVKIVPINTRMRRYKD